MTVFLVILTFLSLGGAGYLAVLFLLKNHEGERLSDHLRRMNIQIEQSAAELDQIDGELLIKQAELTHLTELEENEDKLKANVTRLTEETTQMIDEIRRLNGEAKEASDNLIAVKRDLSVYYPTWDLVNVAFFEEPDYLFETGERFKGEIKLIRDAQKEMIRDDRAVVIPSHVAMVTDDAFSVKILKGQVKLMLKALNAECDALMLKLKASNHPNTLERIERIATELEKSSLSLKCGFSKKYIELKFKECELQYQFKLKEKREKEEQAVIKEQMREEQRAIKEFERALAKAQKEEEMYRRALEDAKKKIGVVPDKEREKLEDKIRHLEAMLLEAEENEKRAKSMAEQTRRGHVYIISNIGSFGEGVYKIGLTRRLEPLDRVKELGDASVPFPFDVHAMIFCEDAPGLERMLHREFTDHRVNKVNFRKEFFRADLHDIHKKAEELSQGDFDFKVTALAEDYYESLRLTAESPVMSEFKVVNDA